MTETQTSVTGEMAEFAASASWEGFPEAVRREGVRAWVNWTGCVLGGSSTTSMDAAVKGALSMGTGNVPLLGRHECVALADSAMLNCLGSCAHTYDDTHLATITHPTGPVAGALLAVAHQLAAAGKPVPGAHFLAALWSEPLGLDHRAHQN